MNTRQQTAIMTHNGTIPPSKLIRWAGLAAISAGILYIAIQAIHPSDAITSVTTTQWATVHYLSMLMDILSLLALTGLYSQQVEESGWLGLAGYLLFSLFWLLSLAFHFVEAFISPVLATVAPQFVEGLLGMVNGTPSEISLGAFPVIYMLTGIGGYLLGGLSFGIATYRAGVLPRWSGALLAVGTILPIFGSELVPHPYNRIFALPVGLALIWMGYALWSDRRAQVPASALSKGRMQHPQTATK